MKSGQTKPGQGQRRDGSSGPAARNDRDSIRPASEPPALGARPTPEAEALIRPTWTMVLPVLLMAVVFYPSLKIPFLLDDYQIYLNYWPSVSWDAFSYDVLHHFQQNRPLTHATWYIQMILESSDTLSPYRFHLLNLALHGMNTILVFYFVRTLGASHAVCLLTSTLFAVHPANMEAVSYIYGRSDLMLTGFLLCALILLKGSRRRPLLASACVIGAVLTKETAVVIPALYFLCTAVLCPAGVGAAGTWGAADSGGRGADPAGGRIDKLSWAIVILGSMACLAGFVFFKTDHADNFGYGFDQSARYLLLQPFCLFVGLIRMVAPVGFTIVYQFELPIHVWDPRVVGPGLFWVALIAYSIRRWRQGQRVHLFAVGWYLSAMSPTNSVVPRIDQISDRHMYLSLIGPFWALAVALEEAARRYGDWFKRLSWAAVIVFAGLTFSQNVRWQSAIYIWREAAGRFSSSAIAHRELAAEYGRFGRPEKELEILRFVTRQWPADWTSWNNIGIVHAAGGDHAQAQFAFRQALAQAPRRHLAMLTHNLAFSYQGDRQIDTAMAEYRRAIALDPTAPASRQNLAVLLWRRGDVEEAERLLREILEVHPRHGPALRTLKIVRSGRVGVGDAASAGVSDAGRVSASGAPSAGVSDAGRVSASGAPSAGVSDAGRQ